MSDFTPGPWLFQKDHNTGGQVVWTRQPHTGELAHVLTDDINGKWPVVANARLIASAPDLLEVAEQSLKVILDEAEARDYDPPANIALVNALCAAIARATGEAA
jgi:hypothetical protein